MSEKKLPWRMALINVTVIAGAMYVIFHEPVDSTCRSEGVTYFKKLAQYPKLQDGRSADDVIKERCIKAVDSFTPIDYVTAANFSAIAEGMPIDRVEQILGGTKGELEVSSNVANIKTESYRWYSKTGGNMSVMTQNGVVVMKAQAGLR